MSNLVGDSQGKKKVQLGEDQYKAFKSFDAVGCEGQNGIEKIKTKKKLIGLKTEASVAEKAQEKLYVLKEKKESSENSEEKSGGEEFVDLDSAINQVRKRLDGIHIANLTVRREYDDDEGSKREEKTRHKWCTHRSFEFQDSEEEENSLAMLVKRTVGQTQEDKSELLQKGSRSPLTKIHILDEKKTQEQNDKQEKKKKFRQIKILQAKKSKNLKKKKSQEIRDKSKTPARNVRTGGRVFTSKQYSPSRSKTDSGWRTTNREKSKIIHITKIEQKSPKKYQYSSTKKIARNSKTSHTRFQLNREFVEHEEAPTPTHKNTKQEQLDFGNGLQIKIEQKPVLISKYGDLYKGTSEFENCTKHVFVKKIPKILIKMLNKEEHLKNEIAIHKLMSHCEQVLPMVQVKDIKEYKYLLMESTSKMLFSPLSPARAEEGSNFYYMDMVPLSKCLDIQKEEYYMNERVVSRLIKSILKASEYFHRRGVVHRDLSPENILVGKVTTFLTNIRMESKSRIFSRRRSSTRRTRTT